MWPRRSSPAISSASTEAPGGRAFRRISGRGGAGPSPEPIPRTLDPVRGSGVGLTGPGAASGCAPVSAREAPDPARAGAASGCAPLQPRAPRSRARGPLLPIGLGPWPPCACLPARPKARSLRREDCPAPDRGAMGLRLARARGAGERRLHARLGGGRRPREPPRRAGPPDPASTARPDHPAAGLPPSRSTPRQELGAEIPPGGRRLPLSRKPSCLQAPAPKPSRPKPPLAPAPGPEPAGAAANPARACGLWARRAFDMPNSGAALRPARLPTRDPSRPQASRS